MKKREEILLFSVDAGAASFPYPVFQNQETPAVVSLKFPTTICCRFPSCIDHSIAYTPGLQFSDQATLPALPALLATPALPTNPPTLFNCKCIDFSLTTTSRWREFP